MQLFIGNIHAEFVAFCNNICIGSRHPLDILREKITKFDTRISELEAYCTCEGGKCFQCHNKIIQEEKRQQIIHLYDALSNLL